MGQLNVAGASTWTGGTIGSQMHVILGSGISITGGSIEDYWFGGYPESGGYAGAPPPVSLTIDGATVDCGGTSSWTGTADINMQNGATLNILAGATFQASAVASIANGGGMQQ